MVHNSDLIQGLEYPLVHTYPLNDSSSCVKFLKGVGEIFDKYSVSMIPLLPHPKILKLIPCTSLSFPADSGFI